MVGEGVAVSIPRVSQGASVARPGLRERKEPGLAGAPARTGKRPGAAETCAVPAVRTAPAPGTFPNGRSQSLTPRWTAVAVAAVPCGYSVHVRALFASFAP